MRMLALHIEKNAVYVCARVDKARWHQEILHFAPFAPALGGKIRLCVEYSYNVVDIFAVHGKARIAAFGYFIEQCCSSIVAF